MTMFSPKSLMHKIARAFAPLVRSDDANVTLIAAVSLLPTLFGLGFCIDYARAEMLQSRIAAVADAAALTATSELYILQTAATAKTAATQVFTSQVAQYSSFSFNASTNLVITINDTGTTYTGRTATVAWIGNSLNMFSGILNKTSLPIYGTSVANASQPANINFYVMLDNSPSMLLPTTSTGITQMQNANGQCAFACHVATETTLDTTNALDPITNAYGNVVLLSSNYYTSGNGITSQAGVYQYNPTYKFIFDGYGNLVGTGGSIASVGANGGTLTWSGGSASVIYADPFWAAENYNQMTPGGSKIPLRIDNMLTAAQGLLSTAQSTVNAINAEYTNATITYKMQYYTFNYDAYALTSAMTNVTSLTNSSAGLSPSSGTLAPFMSTATYFPYNNSPTSTPGNYTDVADSAILQSLTTMYGNLAVAGTGLSGSTPQEILMIVTDGMENDYSDYVGGTHYINAWSSSTIAECNKIKTNKNVKIAILYTTYDPATIPSDAGIAAETSSILPALQQCASPNAGGGYLVYQVSVNQDITAALNALFQMAIASSRLVQ